MPIKPAETTKPDSKQSTAPPIIYRMKDLIKVLGICKSTIYDMIKVGTFPKPRQIGPHSVGWRVQDVQAWVDALPERSI